MTPKEVVRKGYDCFESGDMESFVKTFSLKMHRRFNRQKQKLWTLNQPRLLYGFIPKNQALPLIEHLLCSIDSRSAKPGFNGVE